MASRNRSGSWWPCLDNDPAKHGARIPGLPVLGPLDAIADKAVLGESTHVVVAMPAPGPVQRRRLLDLAATPACQC